MIANTTCVGSFLCALTVSAACVARADVAKPTPSRLTRDTAATPAAWAKAMLDKQVKALPTDHAAFLSTFTGDAVVMLPRVAAKLAPDLPICAQITALSPHSEM